MPHIVQGHHRFNFEDGVIGSGVFFVGGEGKGTGDSILGAVFCFAIDMGEVKREESRAEERRTAVRKQGLIPYDVAAMIGVGNPGSGGGEEEKEGGGRELQCSESRYAS